MNDFENASELSLSRGSEIKSRSDNRSKRTRSADAASRKSSQGSDMGMLDESQVKEKPWNGKWLETFIKYNPCFEN
jgi:hypothetical protein